MAGRRYFKQDEFDFVKAYLKRKGHSVFDLPDLEALNKYCFRFGDSNWSKLQTALRVKKHRANNKMKTISVSLEIHNRLSQIQHENGKTFIDILNDALLLNNQNDIFKEPKEPNLKNLNKELGEQCYCVTKKGLRCKNKIGLKKRQGKLICIFHSNSDFSTLKFIP
jgi:hypothetical protein